jgi:hypothetical protein
LSEIAFIGALGFFAASLRMPRKVGVLRIARQELFLIFLKRAFKKIPRTLYLCGFAGGKLFLGAARISVRELAASGLAYPSSHLRYDHAKLVDMVLVNGGQHGVRQLVRDNVDCVGLNSLGAQVDGARIVVALAVEERLVGRALEAHGPPFVMDTEAFAAGAGFHLRR